MCLHTAFMPCIWISVDLFLYSLHATKVYVLFFPYTLSYLTTSECTFCPMLNICDANFASDFKLALLSVLFAECFSGLPSWGFPPLCAESCRGGVQFRPVIHKAHFGQEGGCPNDPRWQHHRFRNVHRAWRGVLAARVAYSSYRGSSFSLSIHQQLVSSRGSDTHPLWTLRAPGPHVYKHISQQSSHKKEMPTAYRSVGVGDTEFGKWGRGNCWSWLLSQLV